MVGGRAFRGVEHPVGLVYRRFRNPDPPAIVRIWNAAFAGRSTAFLQGTLPLERHVFAKPYFDPEGFILAEEDGQPVGFVHAGFGPDSTGARLDFTKGTICIIAVLPAWRRRGVGAGLLHAAENYLRRRGATTILVGGLRPINPFYWGLYGGSEMPGLLLSDPVAEPFLLRQGYAVHDAALVFQRTLEAPAAPHDTRFTMIKRKYEVKVMPRPTCERWYDECIVSPLEVLHFELQETATGLPVASARIWDMDMFAWRWHQPAAGLMDLEVKPEYRRKGLGKYLGQHILKYLTEQYYTLVETQAPATNTAAIKLVKLLGFHQVDEGRVYRKIEGS